jgi:L-ascorbate metabolism protein UlaG (beta-lactamase superfamily)
MRLLFPHVGSDVSESLVSFALWRDDWRKTMPQLTFLGHSAFLVEGSAGRVVIDPYLRDNPVASAAPDEIKVDYVLLTHGHWDHLGDGIEIAKANDATIVAPAELARYCEKHGATIHPMHIGGAHDFDFGRVKLTIAHHGSCAPDGTYTGNPCGFVVTMDGRTLYHPGDTGLFLDMKLIGELNDIDVAVLPIGDNFTMGIDDAIKATEFLQPRLVIPMHFKTFDVIDVEPREFVERVTQKGFISQVLGFGESLEY